MYSNALYEKNPCRTNNLVLLLGAICFQLHFLCIVVSVAFSYVLFALLCSRCSSFVNSICALIAKNEEALSVDPHLICRELWKPWPTHGRRREMLILHSSIIYVIAIEVHTCKKGDLWRLHNVVVRLSP